MRTITSHSHKNSEVAMDQRRSTYGERAGDVPRPDVLDTSSALYRIRRLRNRHGGDVSTEQRKATDDVIGALERYTIAHEYFEMFFVRQQFVRFGRALLYGDYRRFSRPTTRYRSSVRTYSSNRPSKSRISCCSKAGRLRSRYCRCSSSSVSSLDSSRSRKRAPSSARSSRPA